MKTRDLFQHAEIAKKITRIIGAGNENDVSGNGQQKRKGRYIAMRNPWEEITLSDYEAHMSLDTVKQLQALNQMMKEQLNTYHVESAMILGIAGGNGLEHVNAELLHTVYAIDINSDYLRAAAIRYSNLKGILKCMQLDLLDDESHLPNADLVIANLLIEYIGYPAFQKAVKQAAPQYVSCVIQINTSEESWVSASPYLHAFDDLNQIHHQMDPDLLTVKMSEIGYQKHSELRILLPNGKSFVKLDYKK